MSTIFDIDQSQGTMQDITTARNAIRTVFDQNESAIASVKNNLEDTMGVFAAAEKAYDSLKKHYDEFEDLIRNNEQNIQTHIASMEKASKTNISTFEDAEGRQNLQ